MNVKKIGNKTEIDFCEEMHEKGWWCTILADKINGQPFDCICAKNNRTLFVDVKNVDKGDYFLTSRIEENQKNSFKMLVKRGNENCCYFACKFEDGFYMMEFSEFILDLKKVNKESMIKLEDFIKMVEF